MAATKRRKPKIIHISGRRWFAKTYGNTYHTVTVYVDGECVHTSDRHHGYGDQYVWTATTWLIDNGYLRGMERTEALWRWCQHHGVKLVCECADVARERDL
jgi:hypothetical protein